MTYTADVPQAAQTIAATQPLINDNFGAINTVFGANHVTFNEANAGMHNFMQMPEQSSDPTTVANVCALYSKEFDVADDGTLVTTLFFKNESSGDVTTFGGPSLLASAGYSYLPGGLLVQWNRVNAVSSGAVSFPIEFGEAAYYVNFIPSGSATNNRLFFRIEGVPTAASFVPLIVDRNDTPTTNPINWIAIGKPKGI